MWLTGGWAVGLCMALPWWQNLVLGFRMKCRTPVSDGEENTLLLLWSVVDQGPGNAIAILPSSVLQPDYRMKRRKGRTERTVERWGQSPDHTAPKTHPSVRLLDYMSQYISILGVSLLELVFFVVLLFVDEGIITNGVILPPRRISQKSFIELFLELFYYWTSKVIAWKLIMVFDNMGQEAGKKNNYTGWLNQNIETSDRQEPFAKCNTVKFNESTMDGENLPLLHM